MKFKFLLHIIFLSVFCFSQNDEVPVQSPEPESVVDDVDEYLSYDDNATKDMLKEFYQLNDSINQRYFELYFQEKYATSDYDYTRTKPRTSLWEKIQRRLKEILSYFFRTDDAAVLNDITFWVMRIVAIGIIGLVLYWLLSFIIKKEGSWFFSKANKNLNPEARTITENIHKIDLNALISKYETENNYRFAVRYRYLKLLKVFNDKKLLTWDPDKTNLDYLKELKNSPHKNSFARLTHIFDYVWYGDFPIDAASYDKYKIEFQLLMQKHE